MTVVTKPLSEKKQDQLKKPLVTAGADQNENVDVEAVGDPRYAMPARAHRVSNMMLLGVFLTSLLVMSVGILGGLYLYQHWARQSGHRVHGYFQIPPGRSGNRFESLGSPAYLQTVDNLAEQFDIDTDADTENIDVPDFQSGRRGRFIHDFNANKTGIVDLEGRRCFVMPLNRDRVLPPRTMLDLIGKVMQGYYEVDTEVVREAYSVDLPPITRLEDMGKYIYSECSDYPTYRLKPLITRLSKRSLAETEEFREFAGKKVTHFQIEMSGVHEYERDHKLAAKV